MPVGKKDKGGSKSVGRSKAKQEGTRVGAMVDVRGGKAQKGKSKTAAKPKAKKEGTRVGAMVDVRGGKAQKGKTGSRDRMRDGT